ncbi:hypothetical protein K9M79_01905 [Candidatus Woesearchaeota archaeon]|nr:hypothetical protein [Candidatus Woesearchaeota archaeon]
MVHSNLSETSISNLDRDLDAINVFASNIMDKYGMTYDDLLVQMATLKSHAKVSVVPSCIFRNNSLGFMEAVTKYLKENLSMKYVKIAKLLNRNERSVWITYNKARKKQPRPFTLDKPNIWIPISVFKDAGLGPLESLSIYLKDKLDMEFIDIAKLINRNNKSIWACYNKGKKRAKEGL